jgi:hypothetical protein
LHPCSFSILLTGGGAIALSFLAALDCKFYSFENVDPTGTAWDGLKPPFQSTLGADIGLFSYRITDSSDPVDIMDECVEFNERFRDFQLDDSSNRGGSAAWVAAQFCALFAMILGGLAWFVNLFETCFCSFYCSFLIGSILLLLAGGLQACTFLIFADNDFWYVPTCLLR